MKHKLFTLCLVMGLMLATSAGSAAGQPGPNSASSDRQAPLAIDATVASKISYQGVLRENGALVTGWRDMTFDFLNNNACTGSASFSVFKHDVMISNGLFSVALDMPTNFSGTAYWLRVKVGSTALGCQELLPVPYALTLRPGAMISASGTALNLESSGGNALIATSRTTGGGDSAVGVVGRSSATTGGKAGVLGETASRSDWTIGVWGRATASTGMTSGVWGQTESTSDGARGVTGWAHATSGATAGVRGDSQSPSGTGVLGVAAAYTGITNGVMGVTYSSTDEARGVTGWAPAGSGETYGVFGVNYSTLGRGVFGLASAGNGHTIGVFGESYSPTGYGVAGRANQGWAGSFVSSNGHGVMVSTAAGKTGLVVLGGSKSAAVATQDGYRLLYTEESAEVWFTDYGFGRLTGGMSQIAIDPTFAQTVNLEEPYHVFVQVYGDADVYVTNRTATGFEVRLREGAPNVEFSYRIVAKRMGFEDQRLEPALWAGNQSPLQPTELITAPILVPPAIPPLP